MIHRTHPIQTSSGIMLALVLATPGTVLAYGEQDAIRDCESRIRSEYNLIDMREADATQLEGDKHFMVEGKSKVDGEKYAWTCEVKDRHVTMAEYSGPKPKELGGAEKLAIGAAAAIAIGVAASEAAKGQGEGQAGSTTHTTHHTGSGAAGLQDLVGARASSGEAELEARGFEYISTSKGGGASYTTWLKGSHCVTARTVNGHYASIVDVTMADCD